MSEPNTIHFPPGFVWGAATSAFQIEGAAADEGRGPSIWDTFIAQNPARIYRRQNAAVAADHYHHWREDVDLMKQIGLQAYRFSISWSRVLPDGRGAINPAGLDFYDRLVDALLGAGITPYPTLFHYDLPQALQNRGGWANRDTANAFADYARVLAARLGDRVTRWITHNEPWVTVVMGHFTGEFAPGLKNPLTTMAALHHVLLSHGLAVDALRAGSQRPAQIGIAVNLTPTYPAGPRDASAAQFTDDFINRLILDPLLKGRYPEHFERAAWWRALATDFRIRQHGLGPDDMKTISRPLDFVGVNYYSRTVVRRNALGQSVQIRPQGNEYSDMWEIYPPGLFDLLMRLTREYGHPNWVVSENGVPVPDRVDDGAVHDERRIRYLRDHLVQVHRAIEAGAPVSGYFVWSLLDNFEWLHGYSKRFGIVYVDFATQGRILKDSARWYAQVIRDNGFAIGG